MIEESLKILKSMALKPCEGYSDEEIDQLENRIGKKLPTALKEYYLIIGKNQNGQSLIRPSEIEIFENRMIIFQDQDNFLGISLDDIEVKTVINPNGDNPEVDMRHRLENNTTWYCMNSCSDFVFYFVAMELMYSMPYLAKVKGGKKFDKLIENRLVSLNERELIRVFTDPSRKVLVVFYNDCSPTLHVGSYSKSEVLNLFDNTGIKVKITEKKS